MKRITILLAFLLCATVLFAQAPEKFTYQAVVRNANNGLVANAPVGVRVSILQGSASGNAVYMELHTATTNANGLLTLEIGGGTVQQGTFADIDWANGPFFLKTETDPNGGSNYSVTSTQQMLSVPYALYAKEAGNIPTIPTNVSAFANDAGYITSEGIPVVPTNVSAFTNDAGYLTSYTETDPQFNAWDKDYNDLINKPTIPTVPTNVSAFNNDVGYITMDSLPTVPSDISAFNNDAGYLTNYTENQALADVTAIGNSAGSRQLKDVSDPTEAYDAVNLRTLTLLMDSLRNNFQQQLQQLQQQMQQQIDSLQEIVNALDTNHHTDNFVCGTSTLTDYDGNVYSTVQIGDQCWMRDNLRTTHYADGTAIPLDSSYTSITEPYYYDYNSSAIPLSQRGYLYNWPAVMRGVSSSSANPSGVQGICPTGWHVPSDAEWTQLTDYVSGQSEYLCSNNPEFIAKVLASTTGWISSSSTCAVGNSQEPNNSTGFGAMPAGYHYNLGFTNSGKYAYFWSSTEASSGNSWYRSFYYNYAYVYRNNYGKHFGYSVRCVKDNSHSPNPTPVDSTVTPVDTATSVMPCPNAPTVMDYDGNTYNTLQIGQQCWMAENLRTTHYSDGTAISLGDGYTTTVAYYYIPETPLEYGYLYNWKAVMRNSSSSQSNPSGVQGVCPTGWHVPSNAEWSELETYVGGQSQYVCNNDSSNIAKALSSTSGWQSYSEACAVGDDQNSNNATGFGAFPVNVYPNLSYSLPGSFAMFWSATEYVDETALKFSLHYNAAYASRSGTIKYYGCSVRCLRD